MKQDIAEDCGLSDEALLTAIEPLLEWRLVERDGECLVGYGQGVNYSMTLTSMAIGAYEQRTQK